MSAECLHISAYTDLQTDHSLFECLYGLCVLKLSQNIQISNR